MMNWKLGVVFSLLFSFIVGCGGGTATTGNPGGRTNKTVYGSIVDSSDQPVAGVEVSDSLGHSEAVSDQSGSFELEAVCEDGEIMLLFESSLNSESIVISDIPAEVNAVIVDFELDDEEGLIQLISIDYAVLEAPDAETEDPATTDVADRSEHSSTSLDIDPSADTQDSRLSDGSSKEAGTGDDTSSKYPEDDNIDSKNGDASKSSDSETPPADQKKGTTETAPGSAEEPAPGAGSDEPVERTTHYILWQGRIIDNSGLPLGGVEISLSTGPRVVSNENGEFSLLTESPSSRVSIEVRYEERSANIRIPPLGQDKDFIVNIYLTLSVDPGLSGESISSDNENDGTELEGSPSSSDCDPMSDEQCEDIDYAPEQSDSLGSVQTYDLIDSQDIVIEDF